MTDDQQHTRRNIRITVAACVAFSLLAVAGVVHKILTPRQMSQEELRASGAIVFDQPRRFADFELTAHTGEPFTQADLEGQWSLLFFGFTHCPDICPMTMADLDKLMDRLPESIAADTQVTLVSLDPARDTPEKMADYVTYFDEDFMGVTGEFLSIRRFAHQLNVAFNKVTQGDDYTVDHSGNIVIINPRGDYHGFFKPPFELDKLEATYQSIYHSFEG